MHFPFWRKKILRTAQKDPAIMISKYFLEFNIIFLFECDLKSSQNKNYD